MIRSNESTGLTGRPPSTLVTVDGRDGSSANQAVFVSVLAVLLATGWAANHFAALMPVITNSQHLCVATIDAIFGIYAIGLLPGLLIGGRASDALGRQSVAWSGSTIALAGTLVMLLSQHSDALLAGRFILGAGVGLAISACTAWASDLKGPAGAATAGAVLIAGFAVGPFAAGVIASAGPPGVRVSFGLAANILLLAMVIAVVTAHRTAVTTSARERNSAPSTSARLSAARALSWAIPLAPWVFASGTLGFVTIPTRLHTGLAAPLAAGTAALVVNGSSGLIQVVARSRGWGPQSGTVAALLAALGYAVAAATPSSMTLALGLPLLPILGCASGLSLRAGLIDLETSAPQRVRGTLTGVFYAVTYIGFGLPLLLTTLGSAKQSAMILAVMAVLAAGTAISRAVRLRRDSLRQR
ncbi:MAG TPA: MFS transporter [Mycobacterium sp.]|nr:MFS transporter [Mycobacterium sp.]HME76887.1 MFS transporter [Mycobacterium sp.]